MPLEYRALWSVPGGGAGYSTFYAENDGVQQPAEEFAAAVAAFFEAAAAVIPNTVSINFDSEVRQLNDATGALMDVFAITPAETVTGVSAATYAAGAGGRVDWNSGQVVAGRRLRGRTYVVPITGFEADGTLSTASINALTTAAQAYLDGFQSLDFEPVVWHRPVNGAGGAVGVIQGFSVPDKSALLRSRRD